MDAVKDMRDLVIEGIKETKWYENLTDECECTPPSLELFCNEDLLALYVRYGPYLLKGKI